MITTRPFGVTNKGEAATLYTLSNSKASVSVTDFGATLVSFIVPDKNGVMTDIVLGYDDAAGYDNGRAPYLGATVGRFGNRIAGGKFTLNGVEYTLPKTNNGKNCLHGGVDGFSFRMYEMKTGDNWIEGSIVSPDGEEGFPGTMNFTVRYTLNDSHLEIEYFADSDKDTVATFTNHSYFNLNGATSKKNILNHTLQIEADARCVSNEDALFIGAILPVRDTVYDFRKPTLLKDRLLSGDPALEISGGGIDNYFVSKAKSDGLYYNSAIYCADNGISLECYTDQVGVLFYSGTFLEAVGKQGVKYGRFDGMCLETQGYPDSPNIPYVPSAVLRAGEKYYSKTIYKASVK